MWTSNKGPFDVVHIRRGVWILTDQIFKTHELVFFRKAVIFLWKVDVVLLFQLKSKVGGIKWKLKTNQRTNI